MASAFKKKKTKSHPKTIGRLVWKKFEVLIQKEPHSYIDQYLSPHFCEYGKGFLVKTLLSLEKMEIMYALKRFVGTVLIMNLSNVFDAVNRHWLLATLHGYGFAKLAFHIMYIAIYQIQRKE